MLNFFLICFICSDCAHQLSVFAVYCCNHYFHYLLKSHLKKKNVTLVVINKNNAINNNERAHFNFRDVVECVCRDSLGSALVELVELHYSLGKPGGYSKCQGGGVNCLKQAFFLRTSAPLTVFR